MMQPPTAGTEGQAREIRAAVLKAEEDADRYRARDLHGLEEAARSFAAEGRLQLEALGAEQAAGQKMK